jgi:hypothetical protein
MEDLQGNFFSLSLSLKAKKKKTLNFLPRTADFVCGKWSESNVRRSECKAQLQYFVTTVIYVQVT